MSRIGLILAGGQSSRFGGRDKGGIQLDGKRLVDHVHERLKLQTDAIWISGPHNYGLDVPLIPDIAAGPKGPCAALYSAIKNPNTCNSTGFFTVPIDGPFFPTNLCDRLSSSAGSAIVSTDAGLQPTFAYWITADLKKVLEQEECSKSLSLKAIVQKVAADHIQFQDTKAFTNINSYDDLERATNEQF